MSRKPKNKRANPPNRLNPQKPIPIPLDTTLVSRHDDPRVSTGQKAKIKTNNIQTKVAKIKLRQLI